jgi:hypothetical protein
MRCVRPKHNGTLLGVIVNELDFLKQLLGLDEGCCPFLLHVLHVFVCVRVWLLWDTRTD